MAILNLSADSFFDGNRHNEEVVGRVQQMIHDGADIIDLGGQSTRPGAHQISAEEEINLVVPAIVSLRAAFPEVILSIDTYKSQVAKAAMDAGVDIINDVSGGDIDREIWNIAAAHKCPYILTHIQGTPSDMQSNPNYDNVVEDILLSFSKRIAQLIDAGVRDVIVDPGFGFGKTVEHNYQLLKQLHVFRHLECPVLAGISRKSMIYKVLNKTADQAIHGTTAAHMVALINGAQILRVHDVAAAHDLIDVFQMVNKV